MEIPHHVYVAARTEARHIRPHAVGIALSPPDMWVLIDLWTTPQIPSGATVLAVGLQCSDGVFRLVDGSTWFERKEARRDSHRLVVRS